MNGKFSKVVQNSEVKNYCSEISLRTSYTLVPQSFYSHGVSFTELGDSILTPVPLTAIKETSS